MYEAAGGVKLNKALRYKPGPMEYRIPTVSELDRVTALLRACGLPDADVNPGLLAGFLVATEAGRIVGCVGLEFFGRFALLRSLAVVADHRGRGIAQRLCDEAESRARAGGVQALYLLTTSADDYFGQRGFTAIPRADVPSEVQATAQFRDLCPVTATCMRKTLT